MKVYISSAAGKNKTDSEDRTLAGQQVYLEGNHAIEIESGYVALADGVGGNNAGAVAAFNICKGTAALSEPTVEGFQALNNPLIQKSIDHEGFRKMATTLSGIYFTKGKAPLCFHVGNTRIYAIQAKQYLKQLTEDDTVVNYLVKTGKLREEEAATYPARNEITACFGGGSTALLKMKLFYTDLHCQQYLLTCDGIHDTLSIDSMEDVLERCNGNWEQVTENLIQTAQESGSNDDCTAVIIDCSEEEKNGLEI